MTVLDNSLKSEMVNGCIVTRKKYSRQLHKYQLHWTAMSQAYLSILLNFYQQVNGGSASFTWTDDLSVSRTVIFDGEPVCRPVTASKWDVTINLMEE
jgi:hypothetical protein